MNNIFANLPDNLTDELFEPLVDDDNIIIERIISKGHKSPEHGWYDQKSNEFVMVLQGAGKLLFESDEEVLLNPGDYINIPAHKKHKVVWTDPDNHTIWLAIYY